MARPQLEDGYTQIANEILEHLMKAHLSPNQWQVLILIFRKTYGYHKKVDYIANSQICLDTLLCKAVVSRCLSSLYDMNLITRKGKLIGFQKDWTKWKLANQSTIDTELAKQSTNEKLAVQSTELAIPSTQLAESSTKVSSPAVAQKIKETITKETIQKKGYGEFKDVLLTTQEYDNLVEKFGEAGTQGWIKRLSGHIGSTGKKYKSHYRTILNWDNRDKEVGHEHGAHRQGPRQIPGPDDYTPPSRA